MKTIRQVRPKTDDSKARLAVFAAALSLCAATSIGNAHAEEKKDEGRPKGSLSLTQMGGVYDKGQTPFLGLGLSGSLDYRWVKIDTQLDMYLPNLKAAALDHAELDITIPAGPVGFTPFVYRSQYYGDVPLAAGMAFHVYRLNLHAAPQWIEGSNATPVPVFWTPSIGKLDLMFKVIPVVDYPALAKPAPLIGGEFMAAYPIAQSARLYGKVFEMTARDQAGRMSVGVINAQGGVAWQF